MKLARAHTARARVLAALAVLLVALPAGALGHAQYFCQMMGRLVDTCCCKTERSSHASDRTASPEIKAKDCCQRLERAKHQAAPALRDAALRIASPLVATAPPFTHVLAEPELRAIGLQPSRARAPPPLSRRPIFIQNCSLLT